jgi:hypothetical protein
VLLCLKTETDPAFIPKRHASLKNYMVDKVPPLQNKLSVNFSRALFSALDFLTFEVGADRMFRNIANEIQLCSA